RLAQFPSLFVTREVGDLFAVGRPSRRSVGSRILCKLARLGRLNIHSPDIGKAAVIGLRGWRRHVPNRAAIGRPLPVRRAVCGVHKLSRLPGLDVDGPYASHRKILVDDLSVVLIFLLLLFFGSRFLGGGVGYVRAIGGPNEGLDPGLGLGESFSLASE